MKNRRGVDIPLGKVYTNKYGNYTLVEYRSFRDVTIEWESPNCRTCHQFHDVQRGNVRNPLFPSILGVAYFGIGPYKALVNGETVKSYSCWKAMLQRCYDEKFRHKWKSYESVSVCSDWLNYQNFARWYEQNYVEDWALDKDVLQKNNKIYSPDTCVFVPRAINAALIRNKSERGLWPIGVTMSKKVTPRFHASCADLDNKTVSLGTYDTPTEAFLAYKTFKEYVIKSLASRFKEELSEVAYKALMDYSVSEDD